MPRYLEIGRVEPRPSVPTLANAMDVGNPSNFERLQWLFGGDLRRDARGDLVERRTPTTRCARAIAELHRRYGYVADPHTAIAYLGTSPQARQAPSRKPCVFLATAHPAKFREVVEPAIGKTVQLPDALADDAGTQAASCERIGPTLGELSKLL